ncbi:MAG TPA: SDR family oxidoreductase [Candidatus Limnocylindria bacterium]|jgi:NAD(P)-dependent dehydrogenase (short-subunit alcohol dehydrogenase family)|nr:SDR family oxidoreductase [Candidatus Limnocylindria bacterium]
MATQRFRLDRKAALVTGGASGIGAAIARAFLEQGACVLIGDVDRAGGEKMAADLARIRPEVAFEPLDVTDTAACERAVARCVQRFGRLDILVNNAGIGLVGSVEETETADWDRLLAVNVTGVFNSARAGVKQMLAQQPGGGVMINIASVAALVGIDRRFAYSATKGAVLAMTRQMAIDYATKGVRVNAICPGTVDTPFVSSYLDRFHREDRDETIQKLNARQAIGRMGRPEEIADCAVYLAADESGFVTGSAVVIDGGLSAR